MSPQAPERIFGWLDSQMSVARYYGGLSYQGHEYRIAFDEPAHPLVRADVLKREAKERKAASKAAKVQADALQKQLLTS